ncbi:tail fiber protein [Chitinivorax sp. PXF-14]|uniref:phage tail protein n=1 Tax=Chitinivorax sp. PXF-14 TaxID=3230488 RepID=UPI0034664FC1
MTQTIRRTLLAAALLGLPTANALACGADPYLGTICTFGFNFCPRGWAATNGQLMSIAQNTALFSLLGTTYGGDGRVTFALPDLRGRVVVGMGQGPGLAPVDQGQVFGQDNTTLTINSMPAHTHTASTAATVTTKLRASSGAGSTDSPAGAVLAKQSRTNIYGAGPADSDMGGSAVTTTASATTTVGVAGGSQPFDQHQPSLGMLTCIAIEGIFPSRP